MAHDVKVVELMASAAKIESFNTDACMEAAAFDEAHVFLVVASKQGEPTTLDATIEYCMDAAGTSFAAPVTAEPFTQVTGATSSQCLKLTNTGASFRVAVTIAGGGTGKGWTFKIIVVLKRL